mgnify:CR=1 FL=1
MKLLCDDQISYKIARSLARHAEEVIHINTILEKWHTTDQAICKYADSQDFIVVTKDKDFKYGHLMRRSPKKLILITMGNLSNEHVMNVLNKAMKFIKAESKNPSFFIAVNSNYIFTI